MPWDPRRDERERWDDRRPRRGTRDDLGQADFSSDYAYDPERREGYRRAEEPGERADDYGQADYSTDFAYDPERGQAYRRFSDDDPDYSNPDDPERIYGRGRGEPPRDREERREFGERRSWMGRPGGFFAGREESVPQRRRRGPSDRVLWTVIVERLEDQRGLDLRDVEVRVDEAEVTLNGTVRRKEDKRRIEDIADIEGVRHVQNNLRVRDSRVFWRR
jgi:hypothetical protein